MTVRLYPTALQEGAFFDVLNVTRRIYNHFLEHRQKAYRRRKESVSYNSQTAMLTRWRRNDSRIATVPYNFSREALKRLDRAFKSFFRRVKDGAEPGYPRFKGRDRWRSFEVLQTGNYVRDGKIRVPKLGLVRCRNLRDFEGITRSLRIIRKADRWFAQLLIDDGQEAPPRRPIERTIGLDLGLTHFVVGSDGHAIPAPKYFRKLEQKLARAQREVSRKRKGSQNRRKAVVKLQRMHLRVVDARADFAHKLSKFYVDRYDLIAVEALNIENMIKGRLTKGIMDAAWNQFLWDLSYKAERAGMQVVAVNPRGTTQNCSQCGQVVPKTLRDRVHHCPSCGLKLSRDHNAARNILNRGLEIVSNTPGRGEIHACGEPGCRLVEAGSSS